MLINSGLVLVASYLIGAVPFGLIIVQLVRGLDVRKIGSGRIGGTNVMRAAGAHAGMLAALLDVFKGVITGFLADWIMPGEILVKVLAVSLAVVGQIYSIFLIERDENGRLKWKGGAGGATCLGGAVALWPLGGLIIFGIAMLVYVFVGYASLTTISVAFFSLVFFAVRAIAGVSEWELILYGVISLTFVFFALRPNLERLRMGTERTVGLRAWREKKKLQ